MSKQTSSGKGGRRRTSKTKSGRNYLGQPDPQASPNYLAQPDPQASPNYLAQPDPEDSRNASGS